MDRGNSLDVPAILGNGIRVVLVAGGYFQALIQPILDTVGLTAYVDTVLAPVGQYVLRADDVDDCGASAVPD